MKLFQFKTSIHLRYLFMLFWTITEQIKVINHLLKYAFHVGLVYKPILVAIKQRG
jgi:hypothetical protein